MIVDGYDLRPVDEELRHLFEWGEIENLDLSLDDIGGVVALVPGEADGPGWIWLLSMKGAGEARFGYVALYGSCDGSGWGCRDDIKILGRGTNPTTLLHWLRRDADILERAHRELSGQVFGGQPFGMETIQPKGT